MEQEELRQNILQRKSRQSLIKLLNNIGIIGAIIAAVVDIICVVIFTTGLKIEQDLTSTWMFAVTNALIGLLIINLLRFQGVKYAQIENEELCARFYASRVKKEKHYMTIHHWQIVQFVKDFVIKGLTCTFSIFGIIYISIEGSKNPVIILMALANLLLFACSGLIAMSSAYNRFYDMEVPYMEQELNKKELMKDESD